MKHLKLSLLILYFIVLAGCNSSNQNKNNGEQKQSSQNSQDAQRASPPEDWIKFELETTKTSIYFPLSPKSKSTAPQFMEDELEDEVTYFESRKDEVRFQAAEYRVKPSLTQKDKGLKKFVMESLKSVIRFQHEDPEYDLEKDSEKRLKTWQKVTINGDPAYLFELSVRDGTMEGCAIYRDGYIVFAWAATNAETNKDAIRRRKLFVNCIGAK